MNKEDVRLIDKFLSTIIKLFLDHRGALAMRWVPPRRKIFMTLGDDFVNRIYNLTSKIENKNFNYKSFGINPSQYIKFAYNLAAAAKRSSLPIDQISQCYLFFAKGYYSLQNDGSEGKDGEYLLFSEKEINDVIKKNKWTNTNTDILTINKIAQFNAVLRAYAETIFSDNHTIAGEVHGPYKLDKYYEKDHILIVRNFDCIRPIDLIKDVNEITYNELNSYTIYKNVSVEIDPQGNIKCNENILPKMVYFGIAGLTKNNKYISLKIDDIEDITEYLKSFILKYLQYVKSLNHFEQKKNILYCEYYAMKPLFDYIHESWLPTKEEIDKLNYEHIPAEYLKYEKLIGESNQNDEIIIHSARQLLDPRIRW